ncbi:hypothetical protein DICPUDRAFT_157203 [Dictyostelium purpureum]|uniref:F-box domain-containing protein n=1 Tax=Dictyostelium purpureum TaxID=5786 RepID=F0ZYJ1_DICPU|nr:uncharacterized protein DICPUDRAFT_157203 [Dictyostelium purpureum]EGC30982.1 hypothetical protein DICPUDRAFT_157203 [Dictyostelium purpureum]|eukprot:XP_003292483.1 hypothetical protein DICPUDRAFT_157203 [Dictyostelium purpureum]
MDLINHDNFNLDRMAAYLLSDVGDFFDSQGVFVPKNKCKNRFFQIFLEYLDSNNDILKPTEEQFHKLKRIFTKIKNYDSYKYYEIFLISSYNDYLNFNFNKEEKEEITYSWLVYCLKMQEYHRSFSIKVLNLLHQYTKKNTSYIISAYKNNSVGKDFKLLHLLFSLLSFRGKISIQDYQEFKEGIIAFFNGVYEVFFSFFLNRQWHGIYNENEYRNRSVIEENKNQVKKETVRESYDENLPDDLNEENYFENSGDEEDVLGQDELLENSNQFIVEDLSINEVDAKKKCFAFNTEGVVRFFIYLSTPLEIKINQSLYFEDFGSTIECLLNNNEFNYQVFSEFKRKWCYDSDPTPGSNVFKDELLKEILLFLIRDPSTNQIRKLSISLVSKKFRDIILEEMNTSLQYPIDIGINIYNIKSDNLNGYSLLVPSKVKYLKYSVSSFFDPNLSILKMFKSLVKLEVDGLTELDESTLLILDSIKTLKTVQINVLPFNRINEFFQGFNAFQGFIRDQYLETKRDLDFYEIDCESFPKELNIKVDTFEEYKNTFYGKEFHLFIQDYKGEFDCKLNQIMNYHIHIIKYKKIETTCMDFLLHYFPSFHLGKVPSFSLKLSTRPDKKVLESFKTHRQYKKLENILEIEFIVSKICNISTIQTMLSVLENATNLEKVSLKIQYDAKCDGLLEDDDIHSNCSCGQSPNIDKIIEFHVELLFKSISEKFKNVKSIEISDYFKKSIYISWRKVKLYNFKVNFPFKYIYFNKKAKSFTL